MGISSYHLHPLLLDMVLLYVVSRADQGGQSPSEGKEHHHHPPHRLGAAADLGAPPGNGDQERGTLSGGETDQQGGLVRLQL